MEKKHRRHFHKRTKTENLYTPPYDENLLNKPVEELGLCESTLELLKSGKINTLCDIVKRTEREMFKIQRFGKKQLDEIKKVLSPLNVTFRPLDEKKTEEMKAEQPKKEQSDKKTREPGKPEEWVKFTKNGKWGFKDLNNREIIPATYDEVFYFHEGLACFENQGEFGYINEKNQVVIEPKYECAMSFSEGLASVTLDGKCGYIDKTGNLVINYAYDAATAFTDGTARVKIDGKWGVINTAGEVNWNK
ncbi:MAG: WG repeat-containing protein [Clostridia bacterium]|nr:WG repeat-containing protein [Clostridia bacterium]